MVEAEILCEKVAAGGGDEASRDLVGELAGSVNGAWAKMQSYEEEDSGQTHTVYDSTPYVEKKILPYLSNPF
ncbi:hypothetical protein TorRG33x02_305750 [Trema orientale]|uniref:Uncharacterized protein n=1 Tax=Trema orientale TaxID=63057 RepID=A0A2P5BX37_TREOI|nr:hypothetical protein TorRG33x02_305750 [Trema orientale]